MVCIVAISGSRRSESHTRSTLDHALTAARETGAQTELLDLGSVNLPLYHPDKNHQGDTAQLCQTVREADGVIIGSPVYHDSYSSTFKNFHDFCSYDEYEDTAVGLVAVAGGSSFGPTLEHLRATVRGVHGQVIPQQVGIRGAYNKFEDGTLQDRDLRDRTERLGRTVADHARRLRDTAHGG